MAEISASPSCVIWRKSGLPRLSFVMFKMEPTQRRLSTDKRLKPWEVLTRSWDIIKISLSVNLALILILNKRETKADSTREYQWWDKGTTILPQLVLLAFKHPFQISLLVTSPIPLLSSSGAEFLPALQQYGIHTPPQFSGGQIIPHGEGYSCIEGWLAVSQQ